jgi:hypothetical protein
MPFLLDSDSLPAEMADSINYLLANFGANLSADPNSGEISGPSGIIIAYLYKYLAVKYADSADGSVNFSNSPTNREYYGLRNTNDTPESTNPADYIWNKVAGGFGTTKFLFYETNGGRQINFVVDTVTPGSTYLQESGPAIDLDVVTTTTAYNTAAPSIYIWTSTSTPPTRPSTTSTYIWASGTYIPPVGWTSTPITNTTPGSYLWAITIPLVVNANTETSTLDWTNILYPLYAFSYNGENGATGDTGISAITAYRVQSQSDAAPPTPGNTSGPTAPSGWSLTAPAVSVGQVLWYSFGRYNSSSSTLSGIPPNQTAWGTPTAASIFQDIRSDNWNGSNPPTFGVPSSYGTTGYYIQRTTGDVFFNNGIFRGDINTVGDASFTGDNPAIVPVSISGTNYDVDYSSSSVGTTNAPGKVRTGVFGFSNSLALFPAPSSLFNVGVIGIGHNGISCPGIGVVGQGDTFGGFFSGDVIGLGCASSIGGGVAFEIQGNSLFKWNGYLIVPPSGDTTRFLRNDGVWATVSGSGTVTSVSGTGSVSGLTLSGTVTSSGSLTLGGSLSLTTGNLTATAPGANFYLSGSGWSSTAVILTSIPTNSGTATVSSNQISILGSTSTGIAGAYVGTTGSGSTVTLDVRTTSPSDVRLKEEVADADLGLSFVNQLRPVSYKLKADPKHQKGYGFIADEVEELIGAESSLVYEEPDWKVGDEVGFKTIHYPSYIAVLTKAIQELSAKVDEQQKLIELLQNKG